MASEEIHKDFRTKRCIFTIILVVVHFHCHASQAQINGFRIESSSDSNNPPTTSLLGQVQIVGGADVTIRLFSVVPLSGAADISFTTESATKGSDCSDLRSTRIYELEAPDGGSGDSARAVISLPSDRAVYMFCLRKNTAADNNSLAWIHQGNSTTLQLAVVDLPDYTGPMLPLWAQIVIVVALLAVSATCTALAVSVLSLSRAEMKMLRAAGTSEERHYSKSVGPIRKRGNRVLWALVLTGVIANVAIAVLVEDMIQITGAAMAISAVIIVIFADVIPIIICSRISLGFAARSAWLTNVFVIVTGIFSYPLGRLFDWLLEDDLPVACDRSRLQCLQRMSQPAVVVTTKDAEDETVTRCGNGGCHVGSGGLGLSTKSAKDLMTELSNVFMVEYNAVLDESCLEMISASGFTRIPVYENERTNVVALLHVRDLTYVRAADRTSLRTLCKFYNHPVNFVFEDTKLDVMLEEFKKGQSHMAFIQRVNTEGPGDPFYETLGMITLDDVIEEIFQSEIVVDPPDIIIDKQEVKNVNKNNKNNFTCMSRIRKELSSQMATAVCQFLSSTVEPFRPSRMSPNIVSRLLNQDVVVHIRLADLAASPDQQALYKRNQPADCFTLVVEGHVRVHVGNEDFIFDGGPFMYFGVQAITGDVGQVSYSETSDGVPLPGGPAVAAHVRPTYMPDYTVVPMTDLVIVRVNVAQYTTALRASALERCLRAAELSITGGSDDVDVFAAALAAGFELPADLEIPGEILPAETATSHSQLLHCGNNGNIDSNGHRLTGSRTSICDV